MGVKNYAVLKKFSVQHKRWWVLIHLTFNIIYFTGILGALILIVISKNAENRNLIYAAHYFIRLFDCSFGILSPL
jgi:hypothetical protein